MVCIKINCELATLCEFESKSGTSALHVAAKYGHIDLFKLLLETGQFNNIESIDAIGETPLHYACSSC